MNESYVKDFDGWLNLKPSVDNISDRRIFYKPREVWWAHIGVNVGSEIDGKGTGHYSRPVVVIAGISGSLLWCVPLSHAKKSHKYNHEFVYRGERSVAVVPQLRAVDTNRLIKKIDPMVSKEDYKQIIGKINAIIGDVRI